MAEENINVRRHKPQEPLDGDRFLKLRNILNIIFMIGAVVGVLLYFNSDRTWGTIVILVAMVFKMVESILRFFLS